MASNGRLSGGELAAIPGGRLRKDAAASWNAMRKHIGEKTGVWIAPTGSRSSYRPYADQQYFWNLYTSGRGNLAARPGTSNHGWGLAVDIATTTMARLVNQYGAPFGWQKRWSDAPSEWWHFKYDSAQDRGRPNPKPKPKHPSEYLGPNETRHRNAIRKTRANLKKAGGGWSKHPTYAKNLAIEKDKLRRDRAGIKRAAGKKGGGGWGAKHRRTRYDYLGRLISNTATG